VGATGSAHEVHYYSTIADKLDHTQQGTIMESTNAINEGLRKYVPTIDGPSSGLADSSLVESITGILK